MKFYAIILSIVLFIILSILVFMQIQKESIKIGVIHSLTGTMAMSEKSVLDATLFSIEQINASGGLLGKKVEAVVVDGKSNDKGFEDALNQLTKNGVKIIFGGWTSSSRKAMKPILEKEDALLFYPLQYEGFESSPNIIYLGLTPNQQVIPTLSYGAAHFGEKVFLVGSEYIYPKVANKFIESLSSYTNVKIVGEEYKLLGDTEFSDVIQKIKSTEPSFIVNTLNGDSNIAFFKALYENGISLKDTPVFSFSITEALTADISKTIGAKSIEGSYLTWSYFNSIDTEENRELKNLLKKRFGKNTLISDPMYNAYMGVQLFANSVKKYNSFDANIIRIKITRESIGGIAGIILMDPKNNHSWKEVRIAEIDANGEAKIIWNSGVLVKPQPFSTYIDTDKMVAYEDELYKKWGNRYEASKDFK